MQATYHLKLRHWYATHLADSSTTKFGEDWLDARHPLRLIWIPFYRLIALLLLVLMGLSVLVWCGLHFIYTQAPVHGDDLSRYEMLMPGTSTNPKNLGFELLPHSPRPEEMNLDKAQTYTYMLASDGSNVILLHITYQERQITRFMVYSKTLQLHDLLWRWGRPSISTLGICLAQWSLYGFGG